MEMETNKLVLLAKKALIQVKEKKSYQMNIHLIKQKLLSIPESSKSLLCLTFINLIEEQYEMTSIINKMNVN